MYNYTPSLLWFLNYLGIGSMGKSMEFMGRPWFPHASLAFPCSAKAWGSMEIAWEYFQATSAEHGSALKPWDITFL